MSNPIEVTLMVDLTKYREGLVAGTPGLAYHNSRLGDRFAWVKFPTLDTGLDVLWGSLEITDEEYLEACQKREEAEWKALEDATDVIWHEGPRGGFWSIQYRYVSADGTPSSCNCAVREKAFKLRKFFEERGIPIQTKVHR